MADNSSCSTNFSVGWDNRNEMRNRRQYFLDSPNRASQWEDSRPRYRSVLQQNLQGSPGHSLRQGEMTPFQHGPLEFRGYNVVYPSYSSYPPPPQPAFQTLSTPYSHLAPNSLVYQEITNSLRPSPVINRGFGTIMGASAYQQRNNYNIETSMSINTDDLVAKIGASFPTASETHIRCLLKKYHNREAIVMSALQVEKHPITTPCPFSTPPLNRTPGLQGNHTPFQITPPVSIRGTPSMSIRSNIATPPITMRGSIGTPPLGVWGTPPTRGSSPVPRPGSGSSYYSSPAFGDYKQSPKSQTSPKMKLRYLKSIFPKVEETVILDTLASESNNVMKATEKLKIMGFEKKNTGIPKGQVDKKNKDVADNVVKPVIKKEVDSIKPTPPPRMKSLEEKNRMKERLGGLYSEIPERLIQIAMESVDFDEEKARNLLLIICNEEKENKEDAKTCLGAERNGITKREKEEKELKKEKKEEDKKKGGEKKVKSKKDVPKVSRGTSTTEDKEFKSQYITRVMGRNRELRKGPNDQLLLADYMTWNGPNPELRTGQDKTLAEGPNKNLLSAAKTIAKGSNKENYKGPNLGLAKGSIYSRIVFSLKGESRGQ